MSRRIRREGKVSIGIGWMLIGMGIAAAIAVVILGFVVSPNLFLFLFAPVLLFLGGGINLWMGSRARLEITQDGFIWCGFVGRARSLAWRDVRQILLPPPGSRPRLAAVALLHNGQHVEIEALWLSPTSPARFLSTPDHRETQRELIDGHRAYLARTAP
ncbi:MAG: hypothetical protein ACTHZX_09170 [Microbacterium sp.]